MRESAVERSINVYAKKRGILTMKLSGPNQRGQPDRLYLKNGVAAFVELKAPGKRPTALQEKWLEDLRSRGFHAQWFDNADDAKVWLDEVLS